MNEIRFSPLIRVSTETQVRQEESLQTQKKQIEQAVKSLNAKVSTWAYCGQEHATPTQERKKLDKILVDASKDLFDAVIVADTSRWSKDNLKSSYGLQLFYKIRKDHWLVRKVMLQSLSRSDPFWDPSPR